MKNYMLLLTLFICALTDMASYRIKNVILIFSAIGLLFFETLICTDGAPASDVLSAGIVFLIFIPFYLFGLVKAGDIKLLMLLSMYTGISGLYRIAGTTAAASTVIVIFIGTITHEPLLKIKYPFAFALFLGALPLWFQGV